MTTHPYLVLISIVWSVKYILFKALILFFLSFPPTTFSEPFKLYLSRTDESKNVVVCQFSHFPSTVQGPSLNLFCTIPDTMFIVPGDVGTALISSPAVRSILQHFQHRTLLFLRKHRGTLVCGVTVVWRGSYTQYINCNML